MVVIGRDRGRSRNIIQMVLSSSPPSYHTRDRTTAKLGFYKARRDDASTNERRGNCGTSRSKSGEKKVAPALVALRSPHYPGLGARRKIYLHTSSCCLIVPFALTLQTEFSNILHSILWVPFSTAGDNPSAMAKIQVPMAKGQQNTPKKASQKKQGSKLKKLTVGSLIFAILAVVGYFLDGIKVSSVPRIHIPVTRPCLDNNCPRVSDLISAM